MFETLTLLAPLFMAGTSPRSTAISQITFGGELVACAPPAFPALGITAYMQTETGLSADLSRIANLEHGWDGYDGALPARDAISDARACAMLLRNEFGHPTAAPAPNGDVVFYWRFQDRMAELEFDGGGVASLLVGNVEAENSQITVKRIPIEPAAIRAALTEFFAAA